METTVGDVVRAARAGAGWTREALAARSGVSVAAIEQIETGRRRDIRVSTARHLADALGLTVDELVRGGRRGSTGTHTAYLYSSQDQFVATVGAALSGAAGRGEAALVVSSASTLDALRSQGLDEDAVDAAVADDWCETASCAARNYLDYVERKLASGYERITVVGEPFGVRRPAQEVNAWLRFESLTNLVFAPYPATITCAFDTRAVAPGLLQAVRETHPQITGEAALVRSASFVPPREFLVRP